MSAFIRISFLTKLLLCLNFLIEAFSLDICPIQLARTSVINVYKDPIIKDGNVMPQWLDNSLTPYTSPQEESIDFFYILTLTTNSTENIITPTIKSNDTSTSTPEFKLTEKDNPFSSLESIKQKLDQKSYQCTYNCKDSHSAVKISLSIKSSLCPSPLEIHWIKICTAENHLPLINIGLTSKTYDLMENGKFKAPKSIPTNSNYIFVINNESNEFTFYISHPVTTKDEPLLHYYHRI